MRTVVFIADFYANEIAGGGELVNEVLINGLKDRGFKVRSLKSQEVTEDYIKQSDDFFIIANFIGLNAACLSALYEKDYVIFEHDHKYLKTRDPSPFPNYLATEDQIINKEFYKRAKAVFCQSKIHSEVVNKNLLINNVVNLGCSMWSDNHVRVLRENLNKDKKRDKAIIASTNAVKGTRQAEAFCKKLNNPYELIQPCSFEDLIPQLAEFKSLVFFSQVLETFCRLAVEARILGCKLVTNGNNGCTSEEWFGKLEGEELLNFVESKRDEIVDTVASAVTGADGINFFKKERSSDTADITVILNSYRRPYNLKRQVEAIRSQVIGCKEIWLWVNDHEDNHDFDYSELGLDKIFHNNHNWKFYGRFAGALLADTEYIAIFDDDTVPGRLWFKNCLDTMETHEGILGSAGIILNDYHYVKHDRCGWPTQNPETEEVDLVGHAWFFKREWLQYLWKEKPPTWDNGEDIQFAYSAKTYGGIKTFCPPHPPNNKEMHGSTLGNELGIDSKATSNNNETTHQQFFSERDMCVIHGIKNGWETVRGVKI
tara:strand:+ start:42913 stop:44538 length:1626 start_codon:yes stop_codon:yes gene_type:complete